MSLTVKRGKLHLCFTPAGIHQLFMFTSLLERLNPYAVQLLSVLTAHTLFPFWFCLSCSQKPLQQFIRKQQPFTQKPYCEQTTFPGFFPFQWVCVQDTGLCWVGSISVHRAECAYYTEPHTCFNIVLQTQIVMFFKIQEQNIFIVLFSPCPFCSPAHVFSLRKGSTIWPFDVSCNSPTVLHRTKSLLKRTVRTFFSLLLLRKKKMNIT